MRRNTCGQNRMKKNKIKLGNDFLVAKNWKFDSNNFLFKNPSKRM
jgi:hypothetical protein